MQVYFLKYDLLANEEGVITVTTLHTKFIQFSPEQKDSYTADKELFRTLGT